MDELIYYKSIDLHLNKTFKNNIKNVTVDKLDHTKNTYKQYDEWNLNKSIQ